MRPRHLHLKAPWQAQQGVRVKDSTLKRGSKVAPLQLPHTWGCTPKSTFFFPLRHISVYGNPHPHR